jgi:type I restriction enzyme S subunit
MWDSVKLGDVCDFQGGSQPPKKEFVYEEQKGYVRFIQIRDFKSDKNLTYIPVSKKNRLCNANDIFIGRYGASVGQILQGLEGAFNVALMKIIPNEEVISRGWLFAYLNSPLFQKPLIEVSTRSAQNGFSKDDISTFELPVPPLEEQQRIVTKLDAAFAEIDKAVEFTALKKEEINNFKCSILDINNKNNFSFTSSLNDFEKLKIGDICDLMTGGTPSRKVPEYFEKGEIKWLVSGDINQKEIFDCDGRITEEGFNNSNAKFLPENSVLMALNGQGKTRGTVAMLKTKATCNQSLVSIFPKPGVNLNTKYLYYFLEGMYDKIRRITGDSGNDRRGLNMPLIRNIEILLPPITEQENIIFKLETAINKLDIANKAVNEVINNYKALKSAILSQELQPSEAA